MRGDFEAFEEGRGGLFRGGKRQRVKQAVGGVRAVVDCLIIIIEVGEMEGTGGDGVWASVVLPSEMSVRR